MQNKNVKEKAARAKMFLPFDALKGFHEALKEKEKVIVEKKELSEDEILKLSEKLQQIQKLTIIKVVYYNGEEYEELEGLVSKIDMEYEHYLCITNKKIKFQDIIEVNADYILGDF